MAATKEPRSTSGTGGDHVSSPVLEETYGNSSLTNRFLVVGNTVRKGTQQNVGPPLRKFLKEAFLPQGYPTSVSSDYLPYQIWDTVQAFCSYITGTLATHAVLKGVGVGDSSASPVAATVTWLLKDGLGMVGRILFAWMKGTDLDCNAKKWRLVADILNDVALFLELLAPLFPFMFMVIICLASVAKAVVGVAGGATRAALVQHQARRDNMADVSAKDGSQETLVQLSGLIIGLFLTPLVAGRTWLVWVLYCVFTTLHLYANYQAVSVVCMETLNGNRLHIIMEDLLNSGQMPQPPWVNKREPLLSSISRHLTVTLGVPFSELRMGVTEFMQAHKSYLNGQKFIVSLSREHRTVKVAFHKHSEVVHQIRAAVTVEVLDYLLSNEGVSHSQIMSPYRDRLQGSQSNKDLVLLATEITDHIFSHVVEGLQDAGWVTSHHLLGIGEWRYHWE